MADLSLNYPTAGDVTLAPARISASVMVDSGGGVLKGFVVARKSDHLDASTTLYCCGCRASYASAALLTAAHNVDPRTLERKYGPHVLVNLDLAYAGGKGIALSDIES